MQGFNMGRYVPPELEGTTSGNALHKKRPPGISQDGTQTVRFEMPFAIWCLHCENPNPPPPPHADSDTSAGGKKGGKPTIIGQGVRFNATKRKVGNYHSTPVFAFRMRHAECGGSIEIRTDPKNTAYVVVEGARKRDTGDSSDSPSLLGPILTDKEKEALRSDAFAKLEKTIADRKVLEDAKQRIEELEDESARKWEDPYERNRRLRDAFRVGRKERERDALKTEDLRERMGLGIELLAASEEDARRAALVDFGPAAAAGEAGVEGEMGRKALAKPLFDVGVNTLTKEDGKSKSKSKSKRLKSEVAAAQMRESLVSEIVGNTRVAQDPFLSLDRGNGESAKGSSRFMGIKRKRLQSEPESDHRLEGSNEPGLEKGGPSDVEEKEKISSSAALVDYDSD